MGRIAGDDTHYEFRLCRMVGGVKPIPTEWGFRLPSSTTIIKDNLAIPPSAMSYHGFREALKGLVPLMQNAEELEELFQNLETWEMLEEFLKKRGITPNTSRDAAGDRGSKAHRVLECLAEGWDTPLDAEIMIHPRQWAEALAMDEEFTEGTRYGWAAIIWWEKHIQPYIDSGDILDIVSERPVWSLKDGYAGTLDLGILWKRPPNGIVLMDPMWEIVDAKTHKPASGYTKEGSGAGYDSDAAQIRSYRKAWEEMGLGKTFRQRILILRDRSYRGSGPYLEDYREVPYEMFSNLLEVDGHRKGF